MDAGRRERRGGRQLPRCRKKEIRTLSPDEVKELLRVAHGERFETLYVLAVTMGMHQGEILGLRWHEVDLYRGTLRVRRTVFNGEVKPPKFESSARSIVLTGTAATLSRSNESSAGGGTGSPIKGGTPVSCHNLINRSWRPLLEKAGLPKIPFYNLRHTCATPLLSKGVHPKLVQDLLGHADITTTLNTYSHVIPSMGGKKASAMEDVLESRMQ